MLAVWASRWPVVALRGAIAVLIGILALMMPGITLMTLVLLFGTYAFAAGVMAGILAFSEQPPQPRWLLAVEAVVGVVAGITAWTQVGLTALTLLYVIGFYAVVAGIARIVQAIALRREIENEWMLGLSGALTTLWGVLMVTRPAAGALAIAWILGVTAIAFGIVELALGMKLRSLERRGTAAGPRVWSMRTEEAPEVTRERTRR